MLSQPYWPELFSSGAQLNTLQQGVGPGTYDFYVCDLGCQTAFIVFFFLTMVHLWTMSDALYLWAFGNILLIFGSLWYGLLVVWSMGAIIKAPEFLNMP